METLLTFILSVSITNLAMFPPIVMMYWRYQWLQARQNSNNFTIT